MLASDLYTGGGIGEGGLGVGGVAEVGGRGEGAGWGRGGFDTTDPSFQ